MPNDKIVIPDWNKVVSWPSPEYEFISKLYGINDFTIEAEEDNPGDLLLVHVLSTLPLVCNTVILRPNNRFTLHVMSLISPYSFRFIPILGTEHVVHVSW